MTVSLGELTVAALDSERVATAKRAFTTRRVPLDDMRTLLSGNLKPMAGDLVLAKIERIGNHKRIECPDGRKALLFPGDEIIVCYGNRYAPDQYEAIVGNDLGPCDLVAAGGIASCALVRHSRIAPPTGIRPIGLVGDARGNRLNLRDYAIRADAVAGRITTVLVAGTAMNAGKTLTSASLVRSLKLAGRRVAAMKATGTGAGNDLWIMRDVGADVVADFTDAGFATTYKLSPGAVEEATLRLIGHAAEQGCEFAVIEIADGLQQEETAALIRSKALRLASLGVVFAAYDSMGAIAGNGILRDIGHRVLAISGKLTQSPLAIRETELATRLPVFTPQALQDGGLLPAIVGQMGRQAGMVDGMAAAPMSWVAEASAI